MKYFFDYIAYTIPNYYQRIYCLKQNSTRTKQKNISKKYCRQWRLTSLRQQSQGEAGTLLSISGSEEMGSDC